VVQRSGTAVGLPTRQSGRTLQVHASLSTGGGFVSNDPFFGPHKGTYGAAWLKQLPSRGINLLSSCRPRLDRGEVDDVFQTVSFHAIMVHILRNIPLEVGDVEILVGILAWNWPLKISSTDGTRSTTMSCKVPFCNARARSLRPFGVSHASG
jgi:hypothetical protein